LMFIKTSHNPNHSQSTNHKWHHEYHYKRVKDVDVPREGLCEF
jgi:hypothetical protein